MDQKAFTLIEIVVVAFIVGILAAIALPNLAGMVNRSYSQDALRNLMAIYAAQQNYAQDNNAAYKTCSTGVLSDCINHSSGLNLNIVNNGGTNYTCTPPVCTATLGSTFTMTATLNSPISVQPNARYCRSSDFNPCCIVAGGASPGDSCPK